jgi:hypothetical protein
MHLTLKAKPIINILSFIFKEVIILVNNYYIPLTSPVQHVTFAPVTLFSPFERHKSPVKATLLYKPTEHKSAEIIN